jgi:hypothetical protein
MNQMKSNKQLRLPASQRTYSVQIPNFVKQVATVSHSQKLDSLWLSKLNVPDSSNKTPFVRMSGTAGWHSQYTRVGRWVQNSEIVRALDGSGDTTAEEAFSLFACFTSAAGSHCYVAEASRLRPSFQSRWQTQIVKR